jgi:hypothetical protein
LSKVRKCVQNFNCENLKGKDTLRDKDADGKIVFVKQDVNVIDWI